MYEQIIYQMASAMAAHDGEISSADGTPPEFWDFYEGMAEVGAKAFARAAVKHLVGEEGQGWEWDRGGHSDDLAMYILNFAEVGQ